MKGYGEYLTDKNRFHFALKHVGCIRDAFSLNHFLLIQFASYNISEELCILENPRVCLCKILLFCVPCRFYCKQKKRQKVVVFQSTSS